MNKSILIFLVLLGVHHLIDAQSLNKSKDCKCKATVQTKIVGGKNVTDNYSWQVSLAVENPQPPHALQHFCGGTIVNHRYILTAAHCTDMFFKNPSLLKYLRIRVGINRLDDPNIKEKTYFAKQIYRDSRYLGIRADAVGDFSLIEISQSIEFSDKVQPACLGVDSEEYEGEGRLTAIGWGTITPIYRYPNGEERKGPISNTLKEASFTNYPEMNFNCDKYSYLVCLQPVTNGDSICTGDSGGGLQVLKNGKNIVVGIAQYVQGNFDRRRVLKLCDGRGAYARVSFYTGVLRKVVGDDFCT